VTSISFRLCGVDRYPQDIALILLSTTTVNILLPFNQQSLDKQLAMVSGGCGLRFTITTSMILTNMIQALNEKLTKAKEFCTNKQTNKQQQKER
jgi:hypothetical protein